MDDFERALLRLKEQLGVYSDQEVSEALGLSKSTFSGRKKRGSFPHQAVLKLARERPEIDVDYIFTGHRRAEFERVAEPPAFYGNTPDAKRQALLRYWGALPPELQAKVLDLSETLAHLYLNFDKR